MTKVVCGVIRSEKGYLIAQKKETLLWEFPGGKVEKGENRIQALKREVHEELQLGIQNIDFLTTVDHTYPDFHLVMHAYTCEISLGEPVLTEHVDLKWLPVEKLGQLDWAAADIPIVKFLQTRG